MMMTGLGFVLHRLHCAATPIGGLDTFYDHSAGILTSHYKLSLLLERISAHLMGSTNYTLGSA